MNEKFTKFEEILDVKKNVVVKKNSNQELQAQEAELIDKLFASAMESSEKCPEQAFHFSFNSTSCTMFNGLKISFIFS